MSSEAERAAPANVKAVLKYFRRNPQTADTLEGVARWRLMQERIHHSVDETDQALAWLVEEGVLLKEARRSSSPIFRLNPDNVDNAAVFGRERKGKRQHRRK